MIRHLLRMILAAIALSTALHGQPPGKLGISVTFLANEGVLISRNDTRVIIDGLFSEQVSEYDALPDSLVASLRAARPPFNDLDLLLFTHLHADHYDPRVAGEHLRSNPQTTMVAGQDVVDLLREQFDAYEVVAPRVQAVLPEWQESISLTVGGVQLRLMRMRHGWAANYPLHHLGILADIDGVRILHLGDMEIVPENVVPFNLRDSKIDIALVPFWLLTSEKGSSLLREHIKPSHIIPIHIKPAFVKEIKEQLEAGFENLHVFTRYLEKRDY